MPASRPPSHTRDFLKIWLVPALTFFLVPLAGAGFARYGQAKLDGEYLASIDRSIAKDTSLSEDERAEASAFYRAHPPSSACFDRDPAHARYREAVCEPYGTLWQFAIAFLGSLAATGLGAVTFLFIAVLGLIAFVDRRAQYGSFMLGWRGLVLIAAVETIAQGALAVWLSYWVPALLSDHYYPKLIIMAAILALLAVAMIVIALFHRAEKPAPLEAELVSPSDAPTLWRRVSQLAARLGIEPPKAIAAGIDDNFFVTEQGLTLAGGASTQGRALYVSLPLLRVLSPGEADAIFGHELAHFRGGDTEASARLAPALNRYEAYQAYLMGGLLTIPAARVMHLYRAVFELALKREQRRRELAADTEAAGLTSPDELGRSLLKVVGYSSFREETERQLFQENAELRGALELKGRIDAGLAQHVASPDFREKVQGLRVPHPFDSHPPLEERLANVGAKVAVGDLGRLLAAPPEHTWADEVQTGAAIEARLWERYEASFREQHLRSLAYRYLPANDEERALVLRYFPDLAFPSSKGGVVRVTYAAVTQPDGTALAFKDVVEAKIVKNVLGYHLAVTHRDPAGKKRTVKVDLKGLGKADGAFKEAFSRYWERDQVARRRVTG